MIMNPDGAPQICAACPPRVLESMSLCACPILEHSQVVEGFGYVRCTLKQQATWLFACVTLCVKSLEHIFSPGPYHLSGDKAWFQFTHGQRTGKPGSQGHLTKMFKLSSLLCNCYLRCNDLESWYVLKCPGDWHLCPCVWWAGPQSTQEGVQEWWRNGW